MAYQSTPSPHSSLPDSPYTDTILSTSTHSEEALPPIITTPEEYSPAPLGRPNMMKVATDQSDPHSPSDSSAKPRSNLLSSDSRAHLQPQSLFRPNQARRRQSRFDPMIREEENVDEEAYGELGSRHPLRRVKEEEQERVEGISLPGIKALFGVAADRPPTPSSSIPGSLFQSPSIPSLISPSPSTSPSTGRTSRYSSLASSSESHSISGWWAPEFGSSSSLRGAPAFRANSFPTLPFVDEHDDKRRRSDGPPALRDAEESARLKLQAQSRSASFPSTGSNTGSPGRGLRPLPSAGPSTAMTAIASQSCQSMSGPSGSGMAADYARRRSTASRSASLVGGQLAQSFADLSANERIPTLRDTGHVHADPPDRRPSMFPPPTIEGLPRFQGFQAFPILRDSLDVPQSGHPARLGRPSLTRPSTPETARPVLRRSSLTEIIMAKSGDDVAMASGRFHPVQEGGFPMDRPSLSEQINITGWPVRRASTDSVVSVPGINLNSDSEDAGPRPTSLGRKGPTEARNLGLEDGDVDMKGDPSMRGMEMLAEFAQRVAEEERKGRTSEERDPSPGKGGVGPKYTCAYCAKTFSRPSSLRIHTYSHTGERPFVCKEPSCRRRFSVQSNLKRHAKVHQLGASGLGGAAMQGVGAARGHMHPPSSYGYHPYQRHPGNHGGAVRKHENWDPEEDELDEDELDDEDEEE